MRDGGQHLPLGHACHAASQHPSAAGAPEPAPPTCPLPSCHPTPNRRLGFYRTEAAAARAYDVLASWRNQQVLKEQQERARGRRPRRRRSGTAQGQQEDEDEEEAAAAAGEGKPRRTMIQLVGGGAGQRER